MKLRMDAASNLRDLFATPLLRVMVPNAAEIRGKLASEISGMLPPKEAGPAPLHGRHSSELDLRGAPAAIQDLGESVRFAVNGLISHMSGKKRFQTALSIQCRASIYEQRMQHLPDPPGRFNWTARYFVSAGEPGEDGDVQGHVRFEDPRSRIGLIGLPGIQHSEFHHLAPRDGMLLVHPAWLRATLNPFEGDHEVVMISFRVHISGFRAAA